MLLFIILFYINSNTLNLKVSNIDYSGSDLKLILAVKDKHSRVFNYVSDLLNESKITTKNGYILLVNSNIGDPILSIYTYCELKLAHFKSSLSVLFDKDSIYCNFNKMNENKVSFNLLNESIYYKIKSDKDIKGNLALFTDIYPKNKFKKSSYPQLFQTLKVNDIIYYKKEINYLDVKTGYIYDIYNINNKNRLFYIDKDEVKDHYLGFIKISNNRKEILCLVSIDEVKNLDEFSFDANSIYCKGLDTSIRFIKVNN